MWLITAVTGVFGELDTSDKFSIEFAGVEIFFKDFLARMLIDEISTWHYSQNLMINIFWQRGWLRLGYICVGACSLGNLEAARSLLPLPDLSRKIEVDSAHRAMDGSWCTGFVKEQTLRVTLRAGYKQAYFSFPPPPPPLPPWRPYTKILAAKYRNRSDCALDEWTMEYHWDICDRSSSSTSAWLLSPLECSQRQNGWMLRFSF